MRTTPALAAVLLSGCAASLPSPNAPAAPAEVEVRSTGLPGQAAAERTLTLSSAVVAVDYAARTITIQGEDGGPTTLKVPPEVRRLTEVAAGDTVEVVLQEGVLLEVQPPGTPPIAMHEVAVAGWSGLSAPPAGAAATGRQATVWVAAIDLPARLLTLQGPARNQYQVKVGPKLALEKLKVGDQVLATHVEAVAVQIVKGGAKL